MLRIPFLLLLAATVLAQPKSGLDPVRLARIPERMKSFVDKGTVAGVVTLVQRHGQTPAVDAVGYQDIESKKPMRGDTIFQVMSMTKPVTAAGIMILAEEGRLSLGDPVEKHLPEFRGLWVIDKRDGEKALTLKKPSRLITIRDLMTHTSGMATLPPEGMGGVNFYYNMTKTLAEAASIYSQMPLDFDPGSQWQYSNPGIAVLGRIIEVAGDQPYEKFLEERIFKALGMKDSFLFPPPDKVARIAAVYQDEKGKLKSMGDAIYRKGAKYSMPEGGLYATAADMAAFYQMMLNGGALAGRRVLSKASVEVMTAIHTADVQKGGSAWGLGWTVVQNSAGTLPLVSQGTYGHGGAFGTYGWIDPKKQMVGVLMLQGALSGDVRNAFVAMASAAVAD